MEPPGIFVLTLNIKTYIWGAYYESYSALTWNYSWWLFFFQEYIKIIFILPLYFGPISYVTHPSRDIINCKVRKAKGEMTYLAIVPWPNKI